MRSIHNVGIIFLEIKQTSYMNDLSSFSLFPTVRTQHIPLVSVRPRPPKRRLQLILRTLTGHASTRAQALSTLVRNAGFLAGFFGCISTRLLCLVRGGFARASQTLQDGAKLCLSRLNRGRDGVSDALNERLDAVICFDPTTRQGGVDQQISVMLAPQGSNKTRKSEPTGCELLGGDRGV
jgi:hypothetical protein